MGIVWAHSQRSPATVLNLLSVTSETTFGRETSCYNLVSNPDILKLSFTMIIFRIRLSLFLLAGTLFIFQQATKPACAQTALEYSPAPVMNPLKGLVPYVRPASDRFPHRIFRASCSTRETMFSAHLRGMFRPKTMQHLKNSSMLRSLTANPNHPLFGHHI